MKNGTKNIFLQITLPYCMLTDRDTSDIPISTYFETEFGSCSDFAPNLTAQTYKVAQYSL